MAAMNLLPPVRDEGRDERELWDARLEANRPWFLDWHGETADDSFWTSRKIAYDSITVPTFGICGWYDAYTEPTLEVFRAVQGPRRVLVGPWKHALPDVSPLVPTGGIHEMDRWWDRWLKDVPNGVDDEPPITIYVMGEETWRHETEWPPARTERRRLFTARGHQLAAEPDPNAGSDTYPYDARVGIGSIGYNGHRTELPIPDDQSADDHRSLAYTGAPLPEPLELTGAPRASLLVSADAAECMVVVKLCAVAPTGRSRVISQGNANPSRHDAHAQLRPLSEGELRRVTIPMHPTSTRLEAGERLRLCIAGADFPELWPTPELYTLSLHRGADGSWIELPVVPSPAEPLPRPQLGPPVIDLNPAPSLVTSVREDVVHEHLGARVVAFETRRRTTDQIDSNTTLSGTHHAIVSTDADRPWATNLRVESSFEVVRRLGVVRVRVESILDWFTVQAQAQVTLDGQTVFQRTWRKSLRPGTRMLEHRRLDSGEEA
jgi:predicted acyl esterase